MLCWEGSAGGVGLCILTHGLSWQVHVGDGSFVHLRVFKSLPHENRPLALSDYQVNKAEHDELTYF